MSKKTDMGEERDHWIGLARHMAGIISDFSEFLSMKNGAGGDALVASLTTSLVEMSFKHSNAGKEQEALEHTILAMRLIHQEIVEEEQKEAMAEAKEAKARGHVQ